MTSPVPPTVFVVDDDRDMRDSLVILLRALNRPVMEFESAEAFYEFYQAPLPGCLILDIRMTGQSGLELYSALIEAGKRIPVIFMTAHATVSTAVAAMKTGAIEFLEKPFDPQTLLQKVDTALAMDATWRDSERRFQSLNELIQNLSRADRETLMMLLRGDTNKSMSLQLDITERAVELRRQRLMQRLGVRSLAELLDLTITHRVMEEYRNMTETWRSHNS